MKQKKFGKKVQNWHKPYNPKYRLSQRGFKLKNDKTSLSEELDTYFTEEPNHEYDYGWNYLQDPMADVYYYEEGWDCCRDCYYNHIGLGVESDFCNYNYHKLYESVIHQNTLENLLDPEKIQRLKKNITVETEPTTPGNNIEERIYQHIKGITNLNGKMDEYAHLLRKMVGDQDNVRVLKNNIDQEFAEFVTKCAVLFSPFWLRKPQSYPQPTKTYIFDHVFAHYDYPLFLLSCWYEEQYEMRHSELKFKWITWLLIITQGGSLKRAAQLFGWNIHSKFQHYLLQVPDQIRYPKEACIYTEILRLGGSHITFERVMENRSLVIDPTENRFNKTYLNFWYQTMNWLITHEELIDDFESDIILAWGVHRYTESELGDERIFSWKGRSLQSILAQSREYAEEMNRDNYRGYQYTWKSHGLDWTYKEEEDIWEIKELNSGKALFQESKLMGHCVRTYVNKCVSGSSAIFSLTKNEEKMLTVEISPISLRIIQARGKFNRLAEPHEKEIVRLWSETILSPSRPI
ncbi:PcfJ domain-containing protein [Flagellimonas myxillae]|uniref:PcfJ domain-containing protein n=1 Tax=Flagellimonas myxillae TaxID=2942214 RepID=UPI00201EEF83|nr:PcfJ domain-containing protein [Muricauda myxillae]MCL6265051.1 PcfJ domain-containing protein [Muricauda myxillae]